MVLHEVAWRLRVAGAARTGVRGAAGGEDAGHEGVGEPFGLGLQVPPLVDLHLLPGRTETPRRRREAEQGREDGSEEEQAQFPSLG